MRMEKLRVNKRTQCISLRIVITILAMGLFAWSETYVEASTYHLSYDGVLAQNPLSSNSLRWARSSPGEYRSAERRFHHGDGNQENKDDPSKHVRNSGTIPMSLALEITDRIEQDILHLWRSEFRGGGPDTEERETIKRYNNQTPLHSAILSHLQPTALLLEKKDEMKQRCHDNRRSNYIQDSVRDFFKEDVQGVSCSTYHSESGIMLRISAHFYTEPLFSEDEKIVLAAQIDVTVKTSNVGSTNNDRSSDSHELLIRAVPIISSAIQSNENADAVWSIRSRPTIAEMFHKHKPARVLETTPEYNSDSVSLLDVFEEQDSERNPPESSDNKSANLESIVLSNPLLRNRKRLSSMTFTAVPESKLIKDSSAEEMHSADIWQFTQPKSPKPQTEALFIDSNLLSITSSSGVAHAEAFVHPAMIAHPNPSHVAIISAAPLAIIREVMKYRGGSTPLHSVVVVGANPDVLSMTRQYMPGLDDCSAFGRRSDSTAKNTDSCLDDPLLHIFEGSIDDWLDSNNGSNKGIDVFLVDASPEDASYLLSGKFHVRMRQEWASDQSSIVVINCGDSPSIDWDYERQGSQYPARDRFLRIASLEESTGGAGYFPVLVYDEPKAAPLDTTYIVAFDDIDSLSFERFTRKSTSAVDLDIVSRMSAFQKSPSRADFPTSVYDGPTHSNYLHIGREWESWYCNSLQVMNLPACNILRNWFDISYHHSKTEVRIDPIKGHSLYAAEGIPKGHFVLPEDTVWALHLDALEWRKLNQFVNDFPQAHVYRALRDAMLAYGFEVSSPFTTGWTMSLASNQTFTNHACRPEEHKVSYPAELFSDASGTETAFSPIMARRPDFAGAIVVALRDIMEGEELMQDYRTLRYDMEKHPEFEEFLNKMCETGEGLVRVDAE